tara:strand:+ start:831 stop:1430 length:600 start_codon:yes stop_codon:yes gene_type:complete
MIVTKAITKCLAKITDVHEFVSLIPTPKALIKKKMGLDYVEIGYMKRMADVHFPGWSWEIIKSEALGSEAYVVHGRLKWFDCGIWRTGDMVAAHRIQKKRGTQEFVDVGNDIKSANTDTMKKALNMYLNIADDVYKNQAEDPTLSDKQRDTLLELAMSITDSTFDDIQELIEDGEINTTNYKGSLSKLKRLKGEQNEKS